MALRRMQSIQASWCRSLDAEQAIGCRRCGVCGATLDFPHGSRSTSSVIDDTSILPELTSKNSESQSSGFQDMFEIDDRHPLVQNRWHRWETS